ncbi:MAG: AMP-binding protein [Akkermansiaceae bacterium]|jgi:O-succinylbenzoic acid--CoA ligase|nr:AMP-binding protein [Akkermansiaceae bacterium]
MDAALLTEADFWTDPAPWAFGFDGSLPNLPELRHHVLFETSGSTGRPKWIALSKSALLASAAAVNQHLAVRETSRWGLALPVHHVGGFGVAARAHAAACGFHEFGQRWDAWKFQQWLGENDVSHTSLVPTQVHDLVAADLPPPSSLRAIVVGGGHLPVATGRAARKLGWPVLASYGMTEAGSQIATQPLDAIQHPYHPAPIPLLPIWQAEISVRETLRISGPALFSGVLIQDPSWTFIPRPSPWHDTDDRVRLENDQLTPLGRADSRVKVLGELIDPEAIERDLIQNSNGAIAPGRLVIVAVPDDRMEHALVPVVDAAIDSPFIHSILADHNANSPGFLRLRPAVVLADFPRSPLGKPLRGEIAAILSHHENS